MNLLVQWYCLLTGKGMGGVTGEGRLRAGDWFGRCGGECCGCPEVEEHVEPGDGTEDCCWLGGVMWWWDDSWFWAWEWVCWWWCCCCCCWCWCCCCCCCWWCCCICWSCCRCWSWEFSDEVAVDERTDICFFLLSETWTLHIERNKQLVIKHWRRKYSLLEEHAHTSDKNASTHGGVGCIGWMVRDRCELHGATARSSRILACVIETVNLI